MMCTTAFHSGIVCHVPDSFPEIFRRKTSRKLKKHKKKQFSRGIGKQKSAKPKKPRENKKSDPPSPRLLEYCFFCFFGFLEVFLVLHFSAFQDLWKIVFFCFCFFLFFSRFLYFFQGALPKDSQNVILDLFK